MCFEKRTLKSVSIPLAAWCLAQGLAVQLYAPWFHRPWSNTPLYAGGGQQLWLIWSATGCCLWQADVEDRLHGCHALYFVHLLQEWHILTVLQPCICNTMCHESRTATGVKGISMSCDDLRPC